MIWLCAVLLMSFGADGMLLVANKGERTLGVIDPVAGKQIAAVAENGVTGHEVIASLDGAEMFDFYYESLRQGPWGIVQDYSLLGGAWGFPLEGITKEVHLWQGDEDRIVPVCQARWLADRLPAPRLHVVPGQGHFLLRHCLNEVFTALGSDSNSTLPARLSSQLSVS